MNYYEFKFTGYPDPEIVIAWLSDWPFESFLEQGGVLAYMPENDYSPALEASIREEMAARSIACRVLLIQEQNWNEQWEKNFSPVTVDDFCCIRADFHPPQPAVEHDLIINPKMAFGTGHHETTYMMIQSMRRMDFTNSDVLDFGTGTGILAILASRMGARSVFALDNDVNAVENTVENLKVNHIDGVDAQLGDLEDAPPGKTYDVILANINFNVLKSSANLLFSRLKTSGTLLVSGVLTVQEAGHERRRGGGFRRRASIVLDDWSCIVFVKG